VYYFIIHNPSRKTVVKALHAAASAHDALPGGNKAMLTLNDGSVIVLDSAKNGMLGEQGNAQVLKKDGMLEYKKGNAQKAIGNTQLSAPVSYNTLSTPRGGQYQLVLPDGSKVWLNAASSIRFPTAFTGNEREVELTGEAYFEITSHQLQSGKKMPFKVLVLSAGTDGLNAAIEVLGTHFNVNAYKDEETIRTTLLEGKVKVALRGVDKEAMLNPGEQAIMSMRTIKTVHDIDTEEAVAWKNGLFFFDNVDIQTIMRQLSRWYKVSVVYNGKIPNRRFTGQVSRNANLSQVLKILELSKIHFTIEGDIVTIGNH
jgi:ferric-dicitrate binding protein FerR (iron transport regulator)